MPQGKVDGVQQCRKCGTSKNLCTDRSNRSGVRSICRKCQRQECKDGRERRRSTNGGTIKPAYHTAIDADQITQETDGNYEVVTTVSKTIRTVPQLLDAIKVSRDALKQHGKSEWVVDGKEARKWDQGVIIDGVHRIVELWYVKVNLKRRRAVPIAFEPVRPLTITINIPSRADALPPTSLRRALIVPDSQHGFARDAHGRLDPLHDRAAWACMVEIARYAKPNRVVFLGDMLDMTDWSEKFITGPEFRSVTQPALVELAWNFAQVKATLVPFKREQPHGDWLAGNHEWRMVKAFYQHLRAAAELRPIDEPDGPPIYSFERLMKLTEKFGITYHDKYPHAELWLNDNLRISHGERVRGESGETAKSVIRDARCSEIYGHVHRIEQIHKTVHPRHGAVSYVAFCPGTLARIDGIVPSATSRVNWQQGFAIVDYEPGNGRFWIQSVPIHPGGWAIYDGRVFRGKFSMKALREGTPGWKWAA